jgi:hypothetical protein
MTMTDGDACACDLHISVAHLSDNEEGRGEFCGSAEKSAWECYGVLFIDISGLASCCVAQLSFEGE